MKILITCVTEKTLNISLPSTWYESASIAYYRTKWSLKLYLIPDLSLIQVQLNKIKTVSLALKPLWMKNWKLRMYLVLVLKLSETTFQKTPGNTKPLNMILHSPLGRKTNFWVTLKFQLRKIRLPLGSHQKTPVPRLSWFLYNYFVFW